MFGLAFLLLPSSLSAHRVVELTAVEKSTHLGAAQQLPSISVMPTYGSLLL